MVELADADILPPPLLLKSPPPPWSAGVALSFVVVDGSREEYGVTRAVPDTAALGARDVTVDGTAEDGQVAAAGDVDTAAVTGGV